jgi:hypothetical protein
VPSEMGDGAAHHEIHEFNVTQGLGDADRHGAGDGLEEAELLETPAGAGWTANTTVSSRDSCTNARTSSASFSRSSTLEGR